MAANQAAFAVALCCAVLSLFSVPAAAFVERVDDGGATVRLSAPATRIVALAPHLTEIAYAAGASASLVGAVRFSDYPPAARALPRVGDASRIDAERLLQLEPDLVLAWKSGNPAADLRRLRRLGVPVFVTEPARLADVARLMRTVGALAGTPAAAGEAADTFETEIGALRKRYSRRVAVRVFYEIWHRPLITVNGRHLISDVIRLCGGVNVFEAAPALTPAVSLEAVLAARPEAIVGGGSGLDAQAFAAQWRGSSIRVLQDIGLVHVPPDVIQRASPRIVAGARALCEGLERVRRDAR